MRPADHPGTCPFKPGPARDLCAAQCPRTVCTGKPEERPS